MKLIPLEILWPTCKRAPTCSGGTFDYVEKKDRLAEVELELADPDVWNDPGRAQALGKERASLELVVETIDSLDNGVADNSELLEMAAEEDDNDTLADVRSGQFNGTS